MLKHTRTIAALVAGGALLALPAIGLATPGNSNGHGNSQGSANSCKVKKGFVVRGTLVSYTADDALTPGDQTKVTLKVTGGNRHARRSGELADQDATKPGFQVKGGEYVATAADDAFTLKLNGYDSGDTPSVGDKVHVIGKIALTKKRCAPDKSREERYGASNIKKVTISDRDTDTP